MYQQINTKYIPKKEPTARLESDIVALGVLIAGKPTRYDIQKHNEIINAPQNICRLRRLGWGIETEKHSFIKPSGKTGWLGKYVLSDEHRKYAIDSGIVDIRMNRNRKVKNISGFWDSRA